MTGGGAAWVGVGVAAGVCVTVGAEVPVEPEPVETGLEWVVTGLEWVVTGLEMCVGARTRALT